MKKNYFLRVLLAACLSGSLAYAQLPNGSIAPDFTITDLSGNTHHLYDYLDAGKTVIMDVSATWCGPCWNYHNSHALRDLWNAHGPNGTQSNDVMVLFVEGDVSTTLADLNGTGGNTQGNWVTGTPYPIINLTNNNLQNAYNINSFPTVYKICPNRQITDVGQPTAAELYTSVGTCVLPSSVPDVHAFSYVGDPIVCGGSVSYGMAFQNLNAAPITSATISVLQNGNVLATQNWSGNLAYMDTAQAFIHNVTYVGNDIEVQVNTGDANTSNNTIVKRVPAPVPVSTSSIKIEVKTDLGPNEISWKLYEVGNPTPVATSINYGIQNYLYTKTVNISPNKCYHFAMKDSYGDGICCAWGNGYYKIKDANGNILVNNDGNYGFGNDDGLISYAVGIEPIVNREFTLYPNPANNVLNVELPSSGTFTISIVNQLGQVLKTVSGTGAEYQLSLDNLAQGAYLLNVVSDGQSMTQRFVKE